MTSPSRTTSAARRLTAAAASAVLLGGLALLAPVPATAATDPAPAASARAVVKPSAPRIVKARGGDFARLDFRVAKPGGARWTAIQARGLQWDGQEVVGSCAPPAFRSGGSWVGFHPGGPGVWSFQVRVRNSAGWSAWSDFSRRVRVR